MAQLHDFRPSERVVIDAACLEVLCRRMGARAAEDFVTDKVEQISDRLAEIDWLHRHGLMGLIPPEAQQVARLSTEIGLHSLARTVRDLAQVAALGDRTSYGAIWERVVRIGDRSLAQVWDAPGLTM